MYFHNFFNHTHTFFCILHDTLRNKLKKLSTFFLLGSLKNLVTRLSENFTCAKAHVFFMHSSNWHVNKPKKCWIKYVKYGHCQQIILLSSKRIAYNTFDIRTTFHECAVCDKKYNWSVFLLLKLACNVYHPHKVTGASAQVNRSLLKASTV